MHKKLYWFVLCTLIVPAAWAQRNIDASIKQTQDSLVSNPNFSYRVLKKLHNQSLSGENQIKVALALGDYYAYVGKPDSAEYYILPIKDKPKSTEQEAWMLRTLGNSARLKGNSATAVQWMFQSLQLYEKLQDRYMESSLMADLGIAYTDLKEYDKAIEFFEKCIAYTNSRKVLYACYINLGNVYFFQKKLKEAKENYLQALEYANRYTNPKLLATIYLNLGAIHYRKEQLQEAKMYLEKCQEIAKQYQLNSLYLRVSTNLAVLNYTLGDKQLGILQLSSLREEAEKIGDFEVQLFINQSLVDVLESNQRYEDANTVLKKQYSLMDSIKRQQKFKEMRELEVRYETAQKEKALELLTIKSANDELTLSNQQEAIKRLQLQKDLSEEKNKNEILQLQNVSQQAKNRVLALENISQQSQNEILQLQNEQQAKNDELKRQRQVRDLILLGGVLILLPIVALAIIYFQKNKALKAYNEAQQEVNKQKINAIMKEQELLLIKNAVEVQAQERKRIAQELHDNIGGNLAIVKMMLAQEEMEENSYTKLLEDTFIQVRNLSHDLMSEKFKQGTFTTTIKRYIDNIQRGTKENITFEAHPEARIDTLNEHLQAEVFKIIKELLANALKHAYAKQIFIQLNLFDDTLKLLLEDDGVGFHPNKVVNGLGLMSIEERLNNLKGHMHLDTHPGRGVVIDIDLPIGQLDPSPYEI
ncbi:MAG: tetratricopeptide repeat protein [Thermonemataceae bacterium]